MVKCGIGSQVSRQMMLHESVRLCVRLCVCVCVVRDVWKT